MTDYSNLRKLGLSETATLCYENIYEAGFTTAGRLAKRLKRSRAGVYDALGRLEEWGFIERQTPILPEVTHFKAVRLDKALENLAIFQRQLVRDVVEQQIELSIRRQRRKNTARRDWR
jgi:sugar-specific transcriptional regulator TrmB